MKYNLSMTLLLAGSVLASATTVPQNAIQREAKWILHVDVDRLRDTQIGQYLVQKHVAPQVDQLDQAFKINLTNLLRGVQSVTAYGTKFALKDGQPEGVLLLRTDDLTRKALVGLVVGLMQTDTNKFKTLQTEPHSVYSIDSQMLVAMPPGPYVILGKNKATIDAASEVIAGKAPSLKGSGAMTDAPDLDDSFVLLAVAEGFNEMAVLPDAQVLKMAENARVLLDEKSDHLNATVMLRSKTPEVATQMQQIVEGLVALVSLNAPEDPDLKELTSHLKCGVSDKTVKLQVSVPVSTALRHIEKAEGGKSKPKAKRAKKARPEAPPENVN
jgi:hypothetical protein